MDQEDKNTLILLIKSLQDDILELKTYIKHQNDKLDAKMETLEDRIRRAENFHSLIKGGFILLSLIISILGSKLLGLLQ